MISRPILSTNSLFQALPKAQLDQIQGGGKPYNERPQDFTHEKKPDFIEVEGGELVTLNLQRGRDH
jgi:hypothetical protein